MALTTEWRRRIDRWCEELPRHFYRPLGTVHLSGFTTAAQLTADEALEGDFQPTPPGTEWGAKWEYGWFKGAIVLPEETADKRIVLKAEVPGMKRDSLEVEAVGNRLSVAGVREIPSPEGEFRYHRRERQAGEFRSFNFHAFSSDGQDAVRGVTL